MSVTVTNKSLTPHTLGGLLSMGSRVKIVSLAFDDSYPTGGEAVSLGFTPDIVLIESVAGYIFKWDYTNAKILAYYADYDAVADGVLIQVANATNLSALTDVRMIAIKVRR